MELIFNNDKVTIKNASIDDLTNFMKLMNHSNVSTTLNDTMNISNDNLETNDIHNDTDDDTVKTDIIDDNTIDDNTIDTVVNEPVNKTNNVKKVNVDITKKVELLKILEKDHSKRMVEAISHNNNIPINTIYFWINKYIRNKNPLKHKNVIVYQCEVPYVVNSKKSRKTQIYSDELKNMVIEELKNNHTYANMKEISTKYNVNINTLYGWLRNYVNTSKDHSDSIENISTITKDTDNTVEDTTALKYISDTSNNDEIISYDDWRLKVIYPLVDKIDSNRKKVLSKMYKQMNSVYGIVWEQLYKDFVRHYGTRANSTLRSIYFLEKEVPYGTYGNEHYENILENLLKDEIAKKNN